MPEQTPARRPDIAAQLDGIERTLAHLHTQGTPIKLRAYRQVWRLEHLGRAYFLKFFPRARAGTKRLVRGDPARREYDRLLWLEQAGIPAPKAAACLVGVRIGDTLGDATLSVALEPSETLASYIQRHRLAARPIPDRVELRKQLIDILSLLVRARLSHSDLHPGNFLLHAGRLHLLDAYAVSRAPGPAMPVFDRQVLAHGVNATATRTELLRAWRVIGDGSPALPPLNSPVNRRQWRKSTVRMLAPSESAFELRVGDYSGLGFRQWPFPLRSAPASSLDIRPEEWSREWPRLLQQIEAETLLPLKRGRSADVWAGEVVLAGVPIEVVVKRAFRRYPYRYVTELGRGSRTYRAWRKSWMLLSRRIPTAWPLLMLEKRTAGLVTDQFFICERVHGVQLDHLTPGKMGNGFPLPHPDERSNLFRRIGRLLRRIDQTGLVHFDTKASNFLVQRDEILGLIPVLVDVDGVRGYSWRGEGLRRLRQEILSRPHHFQPTDAADLASGYNPWARTTSSS